jgi:hypothetical protein
MSAALVEIFSSQKLEKLTYKRIEKEATLLGRNFEGIEKGLGSIIEFIGGRPIFQHRTLAEYLAVK